ncbi:MAG: oligosaccharide flippase family protein [Chitinophagaceae bacterium]
MAKKYSYWLQSGKYSLLQKAFVMLFGILSFMVLARALKPESLGVWGLFLIISSIVETLRNALIRNGYVLFMHTKEKSDHSGIEYAAILTNIIYTAVFVLLFLFINPYIDSIFNAPGLGSILRYYCIILVVLIPFSYLEVFFVTKMDFRAVFFMYLVRNGILLAALAIIFLGGIVQLTLQVLITVYGLTATAGLIMGLIMSRRHERMPVTRDYRMLPGFIAFGKYVFANNLFSLIFRSVDSFTTASFISSTASAFYSTCARITNLVDVPSQVFADIMFPRAAQVMKSNDLPGLKRMYEKTVAATLTFTLPAILLILLIPRFTLNILAGPEYLKAAPILQIVVFYGFFLPFIKQFGNIMDVLNKPQTNSILMLVFASLNIGLNFLGIRMFGLYGPAFATLFSYFLLFVVTQIILTRILGVSRINICKNVISFYPIFLSIALGMIGRGKKEKDGKSLTIQGGTE